jgi:hypothetical protein
MKFYILGLICCSLVFVSFGFVIGWQQLAHRAFPLSVVSSFPMLIFGMFDMDIKEDDVK